MAFFRRGSVACWTILKRAPSPFMAVSAILENRSPNLVIQVGLGSGHHPAEDPADEAVHHRRQHQGEDDNLERPQVGVGPQRVGPTLKELHQPIHTGLTGPAGGVSASLGKPLLSGPDPLPRTFSSTNLDRSTNPTSPSKRSQRPEGSSKCLSPEDTECELCCQRVDLRGQPFEVPSNRRSSFNDRIPRKPSPEGLDSPAA